MRRHDNGHRADSVRSIAFDTPGTSGYQSDAFMGRLPLRLDAGEISKTFALSVRTDEAYEPDTSIFAGEAKLVVTDGRGGKRIFRIPNPHNVRVHSRVPSPPPPDPSWFPDERNTEREGWEER